MLLCRNIGECGGIFNLDGHAQIKKCSHVSGVFTCFSRLTGMAPAQAMTRYLLYGSRNRRPFLLPLGFSPVWGSQYHYSFNYSHIYWSWNRLISAYWMGIGCLTNSLIDEGHCQSGRRRSPVPSSTKWRKCYEVGT